MLREEADLDLGLLINFRIQFPPIIRRILKWSDLHKYLVSNENHKIHS